MPRFVARLNDFATPRRADYTIYQVNDDGTERAVGRLYDDAGAGGDKWLWAMEGFGSRLADTAKRRWRRSTRNGRSERLAPKPPPQGAQRMGGACSRLFVFPQLELKFNCRIL